MAFEKHRRGGNGLGSSRVKKGNIYQFFFDMWKNIMI